jgi:hypothetical protein
MSTEIYLEDIALSDLIKENEYSKLFVDAKREQALDGSSHVWEQNVIEGEAFDLVGREDAAWITRDTLQQLKILANRENATYLLYYCGSLTWVRFRHEDSPVIEADALIPRTNPVGTDYYKNLRLKFMEVI